MSNKQKVLGLNALQHIKDYVNEHVDEYNKNIEEVINSIESIKSSKQDKLISGENIKTINNESILGSGNIEIDLSNYATNQYVNEELYKTVKDVQINGESIVDRTTGIANIKDFELGDPQYPTSETRFKSIVFRRTNDILTKDDTPTGGRFDYPIPDGDLWSDGIPVGDEILWSSTRTFSSDENHGSWSIPAQMTDTIDFEVIYSSIENPTTPAKNFFRDADGGITTWLEQNKLTGIWTDDANENSIWMATIKASNGVWGSWKVSKIKGEKGDPGEPGINGTSTEVVYLDNPMDSVLLNANGEATAGFPCTTNLYVYVGNQKAKLKSVEYTVADAEKNGLIAEVELTDNNYCGKFTVRALAKTANPKVSFTLMTTTEDNRTYEAVYLINKISAPAPNIIVDLTNENVNVPCDDNKDILDGYNKVSNGINVFEGATELDITSVEVLNNTTPLDAVFDPETKSFTTELPKFNTNVLDLIVKVTFENIAGDIITRATGFRVVKVIPGAPGEAAEFFELSPNSNTINVGIDASGNKYIKNAEFKPSIIHVKGASRVLFDATSSELNNYGLTLKYAIDEDANQNSDLFPELGVLNLKDAITNYLDLDRYISLVLIKNDKVIDFEKIYMIHDGTPGDNALIYRFTASDNVIKKDNTGAIKDEKQINVTINKFDGLDGCEDVTSDFFNDTESYSAYELRYSIDNGADVKIKNIRQLSITKSATDTIFFDNIKKSITYKLYYYEQTGVDSPILIDSVTISVVQDGANGINGKMMYFDGEFNPGKIYYATDTAIPYVYDDSGVSETNSKASKYFYLRGASYTSTQTPYNNYMANKDNNEHSWEPIESMDILYSKIGLFETANVGPAVFYKDWVFSQTDINGGTEFNKFDGDPITGAFKPAIWFNFNTGEGSLAKGNISWAVDGSVTFGAGAKLNWSSIQNAPTIPTESRITEITNTAISTAKISADNIETGTIDAGLIDVDNLSVKKLKTTNTNDDTIIDIYDNQIYINDTQLVTPSGTTKLQQLCTTITGDKIESYYNFDYTDLTSKYSTVAQQSSAFSISKDLDGVNTVNTTDLEMHISASGLFTFSKLTANQLSSKIQSVAYVSATITVESLTTNAGNIPAHNGTTRNWSLVNPSTSFEQPYLEFRSTSSTTVGSYKLPLKSFTNATTANANCTLLFEGVITNPGAYYVYLHMPKGSVMVNNSSVSTSGLRLNVKAGTNNVLYRCQPAPFTGIFKNGMVIHGKTTKVYVSDEEIRLENRKSLPYSIKIAQDGIYLTGIEGSAGSTYKLSSQTKDGVQYLTLIN